MTRYYYQTHSGDVGVDRTVSAETDEAVISKLQEEFGEHLFGLIFVYKKDENGNNRTVWLE